MRSNDRMQMFAGLYLRADLIDYGKGRRGVLLGSGCGLMMSIMDHVPFRYCVDVDTIARGSQGYLLQQFVIGAHHLEGIALAGWFSISDPEPLRQAFALLDPPGLVYGGSTRLAVPGEVESLDAFIAEATRRWS